MKLSFIVSFISLRCYLLVKFKIAAINPLNADLAVFLYDQ